MGYVKPSCIYRAMLGVPQVVYPCGHVLFLSLESVHLYILETVQVVHEWGWEPGTADRGYMPPPASQEGGPPQGLGRDVDTGAPEAVVLRKHHQVQTLTRYVPECVLAVYKVLLFYTLGTDTM